MRIDLRISLDNQLEPNIGKSYDQYYEQSIPPFIERLLKQFWDTDEDHKV